MKECPKCKTAHTQKGIYCSRGCANSRIFTEESKQKKRQSAIRARERGAYKDIKPKLRSNFCIVCNTQHSKKTKTCSRKCYLQLATDNALKQNRHGGGKKGVYKGFALDSTYELAYLIYHLDHNIPIKRSSLKIKYTYKDTERIYNPDFEVDSMIIEIKGFFSKQAKEKITQANAQGYDIMIVDSSSIRPYIQYVEDKYNVKNALHILYEDKEEILCKHCNEKFAPKTNKVKYCSLSCGAKHRKLSESSKKRISNSLKGNKHSDTAKQKMKDAWILRKSK
jgi:Zn finger protein HypA/HybF involved in hydrogenase expression